MRGAILPAALIFAALGFALSYAPRSIRGPALLFAAIAAFAALLLPLDASRAEATYLACWASVIVTAASVHSPGGLGRRVAVVLALLCGAAAGAIIALAGTHFELAAALSAALVVVPASWLVASGRGIAVKVVSSWLIAIAIVAAALPLVPTPGYVSDHME